MEETTNDIIDCAYLVVFPDYVTGGPGFSGKVLVALYDGGPEQVETFYWDHDGQIHYAAKIPEISD